MPVPNHETHVTLPEAVGYVLGRAGFDPPWVDGTDEMSEIVEGLYQAIGFAHVKCVDAEGRPFIWNPRVYTPAMLRAAVAGVWIDAKSVREWTLRRIKGSASTSAL